MDENNERQDNNIQVVNQFSKSGPDVTINLTSLSEKLGAFLRFFNIFFDALFEWLEKIPFDRFIGTYNNFIEKTIPAVIILSGICYIVTSFIREELEGGSFLLFELNPISLILVMAVMVIASSVIAPKSLRLARSLVSDRWRMAIRPEIIFLFKIIVITLNIVLMFVHVGFIAATPIFVLILLTLSHPDIIGLKVEMPKTAVEEVFALVLIVPSFLLAFLLPILWLGAFGCLLAALFAGMSELYIVAILAPALAPIVIYVIYILIMFFIDLFSLVTNLLNRVEDIRKTLEDAKEKKD